MLAGNPLLGLYFSQERVVWFVVGLKNILILTAAFNLSHLLISKTQSVAQLDVIATSCGATVSVCPIFNNNQFVAPHIWAKSCRTGKKCSACH